MESSVLKYERLANINNSHSANGIDPKMASSQTSAVTPGNTQFGGPPTSAEALAGNAGYKIIGSKKYARKRSLRYRLKHKKSGKRKHRHTKRRGQRGGYAQYLTNQAFTLGQRLPGFPLLPSESALANPPPFMPYRNCPGGM